MNNGRARSMSALVLISFLLLAAGPIAPSATADPPGWDLKYRQTDSSIALCNGDSIVWQFTYSDGQPKSFFHPVSLPNGPVLTWNEPPDHPWHHALWFSWKYINGINYWEPEANSSSPKGRTKWSNVRIDPQPDGKTVAQMHLDYCHPSDHVVLSEERTVTVSAPRADGQYAFDWKCAFTAVEPQVTLDRTPLPNEPNGQAYGGYAGLSVRFSKELIERQAVSNLGPIDFNEGRFRGKANAVDYNGLIDGQPVGIAICDHPSNLNHPTPWYVICSAEMSYYSPAVICYEPHQMKAGDEFTLRYRVIVHPLRWDAARLGREYEEFVRSEN
ncbi:MAG: hypothetical protein FJ276_07695 [Planctomycetes bacterium]|nr:hypothetical protein [Planctomycetota bacterium]